MNKKILKIGLMIGYLLFFILMDFWVITIQNSFITMEPLSTVFYFSRYRGMILIGFFFTDVTMPLISMMFGMLLELLTRKPAALKIKINGSFMTIAFIVGFLYYMPYTPAFVLFTYINVNPVLIRSAPAVYLIPTLAGFCLTKGLLASKESAND